MRFLLAYSIGTVLAPGNCVKGFCEYKENHIKYI
jgi:hypothetical protein